MNDLDRLEGDQPFLAALAALPGSFDGPDGRLPQPYGLLAFGEASPLAALAAGWTDAPLVTGGTQFLLAAGFDFGELEPLRLSVELAGAAPLVVGYGIYRPAFEVEPGPLAPYTYLSYLAHATGHGEALAAAERTLRELVPRLAPSVPTEINPAKQLAWTLWNRVPLLLSARPRAPLQALLQQVFARVGKALVIPTGEHPAAVVAGAFEGRHQLGDDVVGLVIGDDGGELPLVREVLTTRVAQLERLALPDGVSRPEDSVAQGLTLWYLASWVAAYGAILHDETPGESEVYEAVRDSAVGSAG